MTVISKRPRGESPRGKIVDRYATASDLRPSVDEEMRDRVLLDCLDESRRSCGDTNNEGIYPPLADEAKIDRRGTCFIIDVRHHHDIAESFCPAHRSANNRGVNGIHEVGKQNSKRASPLSSEIAGKRMRPIIEASRLVHDGLPQFRLYTYPAAAQHLRHG